MQAVLVDHYAANLTAVAERLVNVPSAAAGEVLLRVEASSVNPIDYKVLDGSLSNLFPLHFPQVLGDDVIGTIVQCGAGACGLSQRGRVGKRVWADLGVGGVGAWAQFISVPEALVVPAPAPSRYDDAELATLPLVGMTMLQALDEGTHIFTPSRHAANRSVVVISSGAGGTGTAGLQLAATLGASHVVTTAGNSSVSSLLQKLGASRVYDFHTQPLLEQLEDDSVDLFIDNYGYDADGALRKVRAGGAFVSLTHAMPTANKSGVLAVALTCNASRSVDLERLTELVDAGRLRPIVDRTYAMSDGVEALRYSMAGHTVGKIAVRI